MAYHDRYIDLHSKYRIAYTRHGLLSSVQMLGLTPLERRDAEERILETYDVVVEPAGISRDYVRYRVVKNKPELSTLDLAIICDVGNLTFGHSAKDDMIYVHTH